MSDNPLYKSSKLSEEIPEDHRKNIEKVLDNVTPAFRDAIIDQPCFSHLWIDEEGEECPETECDLRKMCKESYIHVNNLTKKTSSIRGKHANTGKYQRYGYINKGRPVDVYVSIIVDALEPIYKLPQHWSHSNFKNRYGSRRRKHLSETSSFHAILVDGEIVCRIWTNAAASPLVDVSDELAEFLQEKVEVFPIPEKSYRKLRPCKFRIRCTSEDMAKDIPEWIKEVYKL